MSFSLNIRPPEYTIKDMDTYPPEESATRLANELKNGQLLALALLAVLMVILETILLWSAAGQERDIRVLKNAADQSMLCQRLAKTGHRLIGISTGEARQHALEEMRNTLSQFQATHTTLRDSTNLDVRRIASNVETDYQTIADAASAMLAAPDNPGLLYQSMERLMRHEMPFTDAMTRIAERYETLTADRSSRNQWLSLVITVLLVLALAALAKWRMIPLAERTAQQVRGHERYGLEMERLFLTSPAAQAVIDPASFAVARANRKLEVLIGRAADEIVGRPVAAYFDARIAANQNLLQRLRANEIFDEMQAVLFDGRQATIPVLVSLRPVVHGGQRASLMTLTDISSINPSSPTPTDAAQV